jgi:hypothetical protein
MARLLLREGLRENVAQFILLIYSQASLGIDETNAIFSDDNYDFS